MNLIALFGFTTLAKQLGELVMELRQEKVRRNKEASDYFQQLSVAMDYVVESLRENRVPRISGNEMNTLIHAFPTKTKHVFSEEDASKKHALLADATATAKTLDAYILENIPIDSSEREQQLDVLERITGHCRALVSILSKAG